VLVSCLTLVFSPILFLVAYCLGSKRKHFKSILITGGNGGLGEALAVSYAARGITLVLIGRNAEKLKDVKDKCNALGATTYE
jgi:short-subunit dehydrogenase